MTKRQEAYYSMALKAIGEMNRHNAIWKDNKVITSTIKVSTGLFKEIETANARQNQSTKGASKKKEEYRTKLDKTSNIFLGIFRSYAKTIGDEELYENSNKSFSDIKYIKDTEIMVLVNTTITYARANQNNLKDYGISEDMISEYSQIAEGYKEYLSRPQEIKAEKKTATARLKELFKKLDEQLTEHLDNHMMQYKEKEPQFYSDYTNSRIIYDDPTTTYSLMGTAYDADDDCDGADCTLEFVKVTVKFKAGSELADSVKSTSKKGNYRFKGLKVGKCTVTFEKNYYDTLIVESEVNPNTLTRLNVKLKKTIKI